MAKKTARKASTRQIRGAKGSASKNRKPTARSGGAVTKRTAARKGRRRQKAAGAATKPAGGKAAPRRAASRRTQAGDKAAARRRRTPLRGDEPQSAFGKTVAAAKGTVAGVVSAVRRRVAPSADLDALEVLEQEHRRFEDLLSRGEATTEAARETRRELLATITSELHAHEVKEETVLYPALQTHAWARDIVLEGFQEHHVADVLVEELHRVATDDEAWGAKFKVLKENIEHHIEEEEREMFRMARGIFSREQLLELGARMRTAGAAHRRRRS